MKSVVLLAAVGVTSVPMCILAQDVSIWTDPFGGTVTIHYNGTLRISQLWSDISVRITGDAPITITNQSLNYTDGLSPNGAVITGNGTNEVTFVGTAGGPLFGGTHTPVNSWEPFTFSYDGSYSAFHFELFGQNTCMFIQAPFGNPINMLNADGSQGPLSFCVNFECFPAPSSAALLAFGGVAGTRRRR
ncbi:MAG: hypothetical protein KDA31_09220 [Phycisphaerales bacterium]|nr:hypothetical protein [Phycisphaerales bacterium]